MIRLAPLAAAEPGEIEALLDAAFGADRRARTAYCLRAGATPIAALSGSAWDGARLVGVLQSWPVTLETGAGAVPLVLVGPVAVAPGAQRRGVGARMMAALLAAADADPAGDVLAMVGDPGYYGRFGFDARATAGWRLPGPWEPHRLLARMTGTRGDGLAGMLAPRGGIA